MTLIKKYLLLLALLLLTVAAIALIWLHYEKELDRIEKRRNEIKNRSDAIKILSDR